jgi:signal peptidase I
MKRVCASSFFHFSSQERFGEPQWLGQLTAVQKRLIRASGPVVLGAAILSLARVAVFNPTCVPSASMQPTLLPGDCVLVEVVTTKLSPATRGEIVVFRPPPASGLAAASTVGEPVEYVKRVVAVGGDTVEVLDGKVLINGVARREEVLSRSRQPLKDAATVRPLYSLPQLTVPPGGLFVLGDNRNRSSDSHVWGALSERAVVGKVWFRFSPLGGLGPILSSK